MKNGTVGELEVALAVRLHAEQIEPPLCGGLGDSGLRVHGAHAPMGGLGRWGPQGGFDHLGDALVGMLAGRPERSSSCSLGQAQFEGSGGATCRRSRCWGHSRLAMEEWGSPSAQASAT